MEGKKARDVMKGVVISVGPEEKMATAIDLMRKCKFSQIPVIKDGEQIGSISEKLVYDYMFHDFEETTEFREERVVDMMGSRMITVKEDTDLETIKELLYENEAVLVRRMDKIVGIITRDDI